MIQEPVIAIFDIGKTNKKLFLFNEDYKIVLERSIRLPETIDEDGFPCEDLSNLQRWLHDSLKEVAQLPAFDIKAINFTAYGASLVYVDDQLQTFTPLYSYLKPFPESLRAQFYGQYGGEEEFAFRTASPVLGNLNSGMQLYRLKYERPDVFRRVKWALHLPQYVSSLITGEFVSDITSIGCHTNLWDFSRNTYHYWVEEEDLRSKLAPLAPCEKVIPVSLYDHNFSVGIGLHDSSAALIPYLTNFNEPFVLISTGTWCISLNPFNQSPLTKEELKNDCLCYLSYEGKPVKASRLFAGNEHEQQVKRIGEYFGRPIDKYKSIDFDPLIIKKLEDRNKECSSQGSDTGTFALRDMGSFENDEEAYHQLMLDIITQQYKSTGYVLKNTEVKQLFVDGGFSNNPVYMNLLAAAFPGLEVYAASMAQATALGAALCIHSAWNKKSLSAGLIELKDFSAQRNTRDF